jgi:hypothetical protein
MDAAGLYIGVLGDTCVCTSRGTRPDATLVTLVTRVFVLVEGHGRMLPW